MRNALSADHATNGRLTASVETSDALGDVPKECKMRMRLVWLSAAACLLLTAIVRAQVTSPLDQLFADYYEDALRWAPERATSLGRADYNHLWSDWCPVSAGLGRRR